MRLLNAGATVEVGGYEMTLNTYPKPQPMTWAQNTLPSPAATGRGVPADPDVGDLHVESVDGIAPKPSGRIGDGKLLQFLLDNEEKIVNFLKRLGVKIG